MKTKLAEKEYEIKQKGAKKEFIQIINKKNGYKAIYSKSEFERSFEVVKEKKVENKEGK